MKRKISFLLSLLLFIICTTHAQIAKHVIIITVDGGRPDFYLDSSWHAYNMRALMMQGAYAKGVNSMFPSITYPSHTAIVTGVAPAKHGVYYNGMFEPDSLTGKIYWNYSSIKVPTLWSVADEHGLKTASLLWPVTGDAPVLYNIPDIGSLGENVREQYSKPEGFVDAVKKNIFDNAEKIEYGKNVNIAKIAAYVIQKDQPNLMTVHFFATDGAQHKIGREGDLVKQAVLDADSGIAIIEKALKDAGIWNETVLIITGDHGFCTVKKNIAPNVWLTNAGLITDKNRGQWKAQFLTEGGSAFLYLKDKNDVATLNKVKQLLNNLPAEQKALFRVISKKQIDSVGADPDVLLALSGLDGTAFNGALNGEAIKQGKGGTHGYFPDFHAIQTGFIAVGPGIKKGAIVPVMSLKDIAPLVAKLLGFSFPTADGHIPMGLLAK
ncbi:MAG: ectonucleotide pyrophosphatase/phosphodiesterase [Arachidicoccus sp.]|nr:ectonucleotide pyrophosphatase/phosphodiesterase [Arachidicoccus sp.]